MTDFDHFLKAQERNYPIALAEIQSGRKRSHWIWYIFPQLDGLGSSSNSHFYGIYDLQQAKDYLSHPVLSARLKEITSALLKLESNDPEEVMGGHPDDWKLCSSMTLFAMASEENSLFHQVLDKYFHGQMCQRTLELLKK